MSRYVTLRFATSATLSICQPPAVTGSHPEYQISGSLSRCRRNTPRHAQTSVGAHVWKQGTYTRCAGVQLRWSFLCNSLPSFSMNSFKVYSRLGISSNVISACCSKSAVRAKKGNEAPHGPGTCLDGSAIMHWCASSPLRVLTDPLSWEVEWPSLITLSSLGGGSTQELIGRRIQTDEALSWLPGAPALKIKCGAKEAATASSPALLLPTFLDLAMKTPGALTLNVHRYYI